MGILDDAIREHLELKRAHGASEDEIKAKETEVFGPIRQEAAPAPEDADLAAHEPATEMLRPDDLDLSPEPEVVDHAIPDPHDHAHPAGADPAYREDTDLFAEPLGADAGEPPITEDVPPAAEAGAGTLEPSGAGSEPGPPIAPDHRHDEQHPALHDHDAFHAEEHPPEPVFRRQAESTPPDAPLEPSPIEDPPVGDPPVERPEIDEPPPRQSPEQAASDEDEDVLEETPEFLQDAPEHDRLWFEQKPPRDFDFGE